MFEPCGSAECMSKAACACQDGPKTLTQKEITDYILARYPEPTLGEIRSASTPEAASIRDQLRANDALAAADMGCDVYGYPVRATGIGVSVQDEYAMLPDWMKGSQQVAELSEISRLRAENEALRAKIAELTPEPEEPYVPNENTVRIPMDQWRRALSPRPMQIGVRVG